MSKASEMYLKMSDVRLTITGLICSQGFCARIIPMANLDAFTIAWTRKIAEWAIEYFNAYKQPIYTNIQSRFEEEEKNLDDDEIELISTFLEKIATDFERIKGYFNDEYYISRALDFFRKQTLELLKQKIETCIETGNLDEGFEIASKVKNVVGSTMRVSDLYNPDEDSTWFDDEHYKRGMLQLPGDYGRLIGKCDRGQLIAFLAPMKRGKSWFLLDIAYEAIIRGLKVFFISHEMTEREAKERLYSIIAKRSWNPEKIDLTIPIFDCLKNQKGTCTKRIKVGGGEYGTQYYKPCDVCREKYREDYEIALSQRIIKRRTMSRVEFSGKMKSFNFMYGHNFKMQCANFSSNWPTVKSTIETLKNAKDFFPDVIIEDYVNIRSPYNFGMRAINKIDMIDMNWRETKAYALSEGVLYITAHQGTRATISKKSMTAGDTSGFIDIVAHVNKLFGLNQTMKEKEFGIMRINALVNRMEPFSDEQMVTVLQNLDMGRVLYDSQFGYVKSLAKPGKKEQEED